MILYIYGKCSTCKAALHFLKQHEIAVTVKEITQQPPSIKELEEMLKFQNNHLKKLFNTSGLLYKEMHLSGTLDNMPLNQAFDLLNKHGMLVKRPFLIGKDLGLTGFNETTWLQTFKNSTDHKTTC